MKPGLFTKGGHFICWWWTDGKYNYTNDPASAAAKRAKQEIKYDGSSEEMIRLGLIDEAGNVNNKMRNEFNLYMKEVYEKAHPTKTK